MTGQSASDSRSPAVAARHHSRAPCGPSAATREPSCFLQRADLLGGLREFRAKAAGLPDLKFVTETGERDRVRDPGMRLQRLREDHPALAVDLEHFAGRIERGARTARAPPNRAESARSAPRSPPAARCRRHRAPAGRAPDSNTGPRNRRAPAPRGRAPGSRPAPWRRAAACNATRNGPWRPLLTHGRPRQSCLRTTAVDGKQWAIMGLLGRQWNRAVTRASAHNRSPPARRNSLLTMSRLKEWLKNTRATNANLSPHARSAQRD